MYIAIQNILNVIVYLYLHENMMKVYLIEDRDRGLCKIGITKRKVSQRIYDMKTSNPGDIVELYSFNSDHAPKIEKALHRLWANKRISGEWFNLSSADKKMFMERCAILDKSINDLLSVQGDDNDIYTL